MSAIPKLSLLVYSGRENPSVEIPKLKFNALIDEIGSQVKISNKNFIPKLGEIGFSLSSEKYYVEIFREFCSLEKYSAVTYFRTDPKLFESVLNLFFSIYKESDLEVLKGHITK